jgi:hypothetical protein
MKCALCLQEKDLCQSHIFPEFFYRPMYDEKGRYFQISTSPTKRNVTRQKGIWEKILCRECEGQLSQLEDYARRVLYGGIEIVISEQPGKLIIHNMEYTKFKLFQMSLLWRAGVSKRPEFNKVSLGPHQERLRQRIFSGNPGAPYEYGCMIICTPSLPKEINDLIIPPECVRVDGHRRYRTMLGGMWWLFFVSGQMCDLEQRNLFLTPDGRMPVFFEDNHSVEFIRKFAAELKHAGKLEGFK